MKYSDQKKIRQKGLQNNCGPMLAMLQLVSSQFASPSKLVEERKQGKVQSSTAFRLVADFSLESIFANPESFSEILSRPRE